MSQRSSKTDTPSIKPKAVLHFPKNGKFSAKREILHTHKKKLALKGFRGLKMQLKQGALKKI